jgi:alpha-aminoadipic semialdehyde synthase
MYVDQQARLKVIGDISCDVEGAIECTVKATEPDEPVFVYDPSTDKAIDGVEGNGPVIMAVEILPTELPRESSTYFSGVFKDYIPAIASADYEVSFDGLELPAEIKRAIVVHRGKLTPDYTYIEKYL